jgi:hypothetical protein
LPVSFRAVFQPVTTAPIRNEAVDRRRTMKVDLLARPESREADDTKVAALVLALEPAPTNV